MVFHFGGHLLVRVVVVPDCLAGLVVRCLPVLVVGCLLALVRDLRSRPAGFGLDYYCPWLLVVVELVYRRGGLCPVVTICKKVVGGLLIFSLEFLKD